MITFDAHYFDGQSSQARGARVTFDGSTLSIEGAFGVVKHPIKDIEIEPQMAGTSRVIFLGRAKLETQNQQAVADLEGVLGQNVFISKMVKAESSKRYALIASVVLVAFVAASYTWGIPFLADRLAEATPPSVLNQASKQTVVLIDKMTSPTELPSARQKQYQAIFKRVIGLMGVEGTFTLHLRKGDTIGPNAFALPSGDVYYTDELIKLSKSDAEIEAIMAHEIGHVIHKHSMRTAYRSAGVSALLAGLLGDVSNLGNLVSTLPASIMNSKYSRNFELEADKEGGKFLLKQYGTTKAMRQAFETLEGATGGDSASTAMLSSHPQSKQRIQALERMEQEYKK